MSPKKVSSPRLRTKPGIRPGSFEDFFENGAVPLHLVGADGTILHANKAELDLLGYTAEDYIGHHIAEFHAEQATIEDILARLTHGEILAKYPARLRARDGAIKHVEISSSVQFRDGEFLNTRCFTVDVTEQELVRADAARRMSQLSAIYRFSEELQFAGSLPDIYNAALDAIVDVLGCTRASIRLGDSSGTFRFVAWRGLSETYRATVENLTQWPGDGANTPPAFVDDVGPADIPAPLKQAMNTEGIRALGFIPMVTDGKLLGMFNAYYDSPYAFEDQEKELGRTTARQVALGIDRKRTEEQLRRNEERLRLATSAGKIGIWEWEIATNQVSWTDSLYAIHGVDKATFGATAENFIDLVHPDDRDRVSQALERALRDDAPYEIEFRAVRPNGEIFWLYTDAAVLRERGEPKRMLGATMDITERKQAEEQFRLAVEAAPSGMLLTDQDGRIVMANAQTEALFGYSRDALLGKPVEILIPPRFADGHVALRHSYARQPEVRGMGIGRELFARRQDGSEFPVEIGLSPIRTGRGLVVLAAIVDITERARAAEREQMLTREVEHRSRNLLAVIQAIVRLSLSGDRTIDEARAMIEARLRSLGRSVEQLTDANWTGLNLRAIVDSELELFEEQIAVEGSDVVLQPQEAQNFALALHELATNAAKYGALSCPDGRVDIGWSVEDRQDESCLRLSWREHGGPPVVAPQRQGFGSSLLKGAFAETRLDYAAEGLRCEIEVKLASRPPAGPSGRGQR